LRLKVIWSFVALLLLLIQYFKIIKNWTALLFWCFSTTMATIPEYYRDKSIFVTGATGFIGKVLVEKVLRSCPEIQAIYCLTRPKQGDSAADRLSRMLSEPVCLILL